MNKYIIFLVSIISAGLYSPEFRTLGGNEIKAPDDLPEMFETLLPINLQKIFLNPEKCYAPGCLEENVIRPRKLFKKFVTNHDEKKRITEITFISQGGSYWQVHFSTKEPKPMQFLPMKIGKYEIIYQRVSLKPDLLSGTTQVIMSLEIRPTDKSEEYRGSGKIEVISVLHECGPTQDIMEKCLSHEDTKMSFNFSIRNMEFTGELNSKPFLKTKTKKQISLQESIAKLGFYFSTGDFMLQAASNTTKYQRIWQEASLAKDKVHYLQDPENPENFTLEIITPFSNLLHLHIKDLKYTHADYHPIKKYFELPIGEVSYTREIEVKFPTTESQKDVIAQVTFIIPADWKLKHLCPQGIFFNALVQMLWPCNDVSNLLMRLGEKLGKQLLSMDELVLKEVLITNT